MNNKVTYRNDKQYLENARSPLNNVYAINKSSLNK
jgi:hypothetical protein